MRIQGRWSAASAAAGVLTLAVLAAPAAAQRGMMRGGPPGQQERAQLEQRIRARFGEQIRQRLGLDEATAKALNQAVESFRPQREQLARDQEALRKRIQAFAIEGDGTDQQAQELLDRMDQLRVQEGRLYDNEQDSLKKVLSPTQLLMFNVMREQLAQRIQQLRSGGMMGRRGPGRGGEPGGGVGRGVPGGGGGGGAIDPLDPLGWPPAGGR